MTFVNGQGERKAGRGLRLDLCTARNTRQRMKVKSHDVGKSKKPYRSSPSAELHPTTPSAKSRAEPPSSAVASFCVMRAHYRIDQAEQNPDQLLGSFRAVVYAKDNDS